jgi:RNA polymerase sigma factor (sigma-70 family)
MQSLDRTSSKELQLLAERLIAEFDEYLLNFLRSLLNIRGGFEGPERDLLQETWLKACRKIDGRLLVIDSNRVWRAWLKRIALNEFLQFVRGKRRGIRREVGHAKWSAAYHGEARSEVEQVSTKMDLYNALRRGCDKKSRIIIRLIVKGWTFEEIADKLKMSKSSVHRLYQQAVKTVRSILPDEG